MPKPITINPKKCSWIEKKDKDFFRGALGR